MVNRLLHKHKLLTGIVLKPGLTSSLYPCPCTTK